MEAKKFIDFIITQKCTYRCVYCSQSKPEQQEYKEADSKTIDNFLKFLDSIEKDFEITISGGEAILHQAFFGLAEKIKNKGFKINLITNFSFDIETYKKIFNLLDVNLNQFDISFHLDEISNFDLALDKLHKLIKFKSNETKFVFNVPIFNLDNEKEEKIKQIVKIAKENDITVNFQHIRILNKYIKYSDKEQKYFKNEKFTKSFAKNCWAGCCSVVIFEDGSVYRCYSSKFNKSNYLGNLNDSGFELNKSLNPCTNQYCTCPKPVAYNQITDDKNYLSAVITSLYNFSYLPILIFKNRKRVLEKIRQKISYF